ncbi:MAG: hypothetical protein K6G33_14265 [Ruminococcus sp.]|jgi:hypothetical protein|uniref:hypothetical protein n=1 Tax=Ruminococcus sp. TaxID=41978 RepID=UPI0025EF9B5F|nr:hypothetical protein [Ruminococcus sp.]MCR5601886.1 hypothetical protein [Ruminococcus sp.]
MKKILSINTEIDYQPDNNFDIIITELTERAEFFCTDNDKPLFCDRYYDPSSTCGIDSY